MLDYSIVPNIMETYPLPITLLITYLSSGSLSLLTLVTKGPGQHEVDAQRICIMQDFISGVA